MKLQNIVFYEVLCEPMLSHLQNTTNSQNWNMLTPKNNFLAQRVIRAVPGHSLHPPLIENQNGRHIRKFPIQTGRSWGRGWESGRKRLRRDWERLEERLGEFCMSFLRLRLIGQIFERQSFVRRSFLRQTFVRLSFARQSCVRLSSVRRSFVRLRFVRLCL